MIQGGYSVNPLKKWFRSPGIGHGDRFILSDIDPDRPGLEVYAIQQSALLGQLLYDARTAERIKEWYLPSVYDVGRGACMDVDASRKGYELYSFTDDFVYDCKGDKTNYTRSCPTPILLGSIFTNSASGSISRLPMLTAPRTVTSSSGNSSRAIGEAE